ncbi:multidrug efflux pump subunit AcrB [Paraburkholderia sp. CI3]
MWIVQLALRRTYTFVVLAVLILIVGPLAILRTPTDIFPNIDIPVVSIVWTYNGFSAQDMANRITSNYERALSSDVDDIEHIESQSLNGVSVVKIFFHPGADINRAIAEAASNSASILRVLPPGTLPPNIITYNASTVPILQLGLSSDTLSEQQLYDLGNSAIRTQLATVQGASVPLPFGGKVRQIMVDIVCWHSPASLERCSRVADDTLFVKRGGCPKHPGSGRWYRNPMTGQCGSARLIHP